MKKLLCSLFIYTLVMCYCFCRPGPRVVFYVDNSTQQNVFIEYELVHGESDPERNYYWKQEINHQLITLFDALHNKSGIKIPPRKKFPIVEFYPTGKLVDLQNRFEGLRPIPLIDLLKNTYKILRIFTEDGKNVITLESFENETIIINDSPGGVSYVIKISEEDF